jgi:O-antigen/teichoic acid export membrane protein
MATVKLKTGFFSYTVLSFLEKGISFLLVFILSFYLLPEDMGKISLYLAVFAFAQPFVSLYTNSAVMLGWNYHKDHFADYFTSALVLNSLSFLVVFLISLAFILFAKNIFDLPWYFLTISLVVYFESLKANLIAFFQVKQQIFLVGMILITSSVVLLGITFLGLQLLNLGFYARIAGMCLNGLIMVSISLYYISKEKLWGKFSPVFLKDALYYGLPLIPHALGILMIDLSDRLFIGKLSGEYELGLYSIAYTVTSVIGLINTSFFSSWNPHLYELLYEGSHTSKTKVAETYIYFIVGLVLLCLVSIVIVPFVFRFLINVRYIGALKFVPWLILYYFLHGIYMVFSSMLFFAKKTKYFMFISLVNILLSVVLNYLLINRYGSLGAAYATVISMFVFMILVLFLSNRIIALPWGTALRKLAGFKTGAGS